jgi:hypothetical protein
MLENKPATYQRHGSRIVSVVRESHFLRNSKKRQLESQSLFDSLSCNRMSAHVLRERCWVSRLHEDGTRT